MEYISGKKKNARIKWNIGQTAELGKSTLQVPPMWLLQNYMVQLEFVVNLTGKTEQHGFSVLQPLIESPYWCGGKIHTQIRTYIHTATQRIYIWHHTHCRRDSCKKAKEALGRFWINEGQECFHKKQCNQLDLEGQSKLWKLFYVWRSEGNSKTFLDFFRLNW